MTLFTTFYLSRVLGKKVFDTNGKSLGVIIDILIESLHDVSDDSVRPKVLGLKIKTGGNTAVYTIQNFTLSKANGKINVNCTQLLELQSDIVEGGLFLGETILDKQIVDLNGHKLVRVNDVRLAIVGDGTYAIAVDVGMEGLLRRIGISKPVKSVLSLFNLNLTTKFILWDDVQAIDFSNYNIKLSKSYTKLHTLHPSDLADIIEDMSKSSSATVFSALDEEKAADVLEELETQTQIHIIESLPVEKMADVLEKMPADEVADILDELEDEKAESLLKEMDAESSQEVRELLEYPEHLVGSLMTTEFLVFHQNKTVEEVLRDLREKKPESAELYSLFVTDSNEELLGTFDLRDLVVSNPELQVGQIMKLEPVCLYDDQKFDDIAEIISRYNLLAIPVVDRDNLLQGMVVIDDVVEDLMNKRRTAKH